MVFSQEEIEEFKVEALERLDEPKKNSFCFVLRAPFHPHPSKRSRLRDALVSRAKNPVAEATQEDICFRKKHAF